MKTITIQIGNSDDKLSQSSWSAFIHRVNNTIDIYAYDVYFTGFSLPTAGWQNACWVFSITHEKSLRLWGEMKVICSDFKQNSIAWTEGDTTFING